MTSIWERGKTMSDRAVLYVVVVIAGVGLLVLAYGVIQVVRSLP